MSSYQIWVFRVHPSLPQIGLVQPQSPAVSWDWRWRPSAGLPVRKAEFRWSGVLCDAGSPEDTCTPDSGPPHDSEKQVSVLLSKMVGSRGPSLAYRRLVCKISQHIYVCLNETGFGFCKSANIMESCVHSWMVPFTQYCCWGFFPQVNAWAVMHSFFGTYSTVYAFIFSWVDIDVVSSFFLLFLARVLLQRSLCSSPRVHMEEFL